MDTIVTLTEQEKTELRETQQKLQSLVADMLTPDDFSKIRQILQKAL